MNVFIALKWTHFLFLFGVQCGKNTLIFTNLRDQNTQNHTLNQLWFPFCRTEDTYEYWKNDTIFFTSILHDKGSLFGDRLSMTTCPPSCQIASSFQLSLECCLEAVLSFFMSFSEWWPVCWCGNPQLGWHVWTDVREAFPFPWFNAQWLPMGLNLFFVWFSRNFNENISCPMVNYS